MLSSVVIRRLTTLLNQELMKRQNKPFANLKIMRVTGRSAVFGHRSLANMAASPVSESKEPLKENSEENIVWVDMEMTGLDPGKDHVLEVACLVTDSQLNIIAEGPDLTIHQPPEVLANMNDWSTHQHRESGLAEESRVSQVSLREAEQQLLSFVRTYAPFKKCPLGGNTIYIDRLFLMKHMPEFEQHMHYRIIDVSSIKELCRRWYPDLYNEQPNKKDQSKHRALADIVMSITELKFYKEKIFRKPEVGEAMGMSWC